MSVCGETSIKVDHKSLVGWERGDKWKQKDKKRETVSVEKTKSSVSDNFCASSTRVVCTCIGWRERRRSESERSKLYENTSERKQLKVMASHLISSHLLSRDTFKFIICIKDAISVPEVRVEASNWFKAACIFLSLSKFNLYTVKVCCVRASKLDHKLRYTHEMEREKAKESKLNENQRERGSRGSLQV